LLVEARVEIADDGNLASFLAYEDFCNLETFLGQLLSPWVMHAECHGNGDPMIVMDSATAR
jgi:hypothetical protein